MNKFRAITLLIVALPCLALAQLQVKNYFSVTGKKDVPITKIVQDQSGYLWLGTAEGVYKFDGKNAEKLLPLSLLSGKAVTALHVDSKDCLWIGTRTGEVYFYDGKKIDSLILPENESPEKITSFYELNSVLIIGTYGNGLYTRTKDSIYHINTTKGLSDNVIYNIIGDAENTIWCGTDAGVSELSFLKEKASCKIISYKEGLPDNIVRDLAFNNNRLYIAMQDSGVCFYNTKGQKIERNSFFSSWSMGAVVNIHASSRGSITLATEKSGIIQIENGTVSMYDYEKYIQCTSINHLFVDREQQIWVGSKKGLSHFVERRYNILNAAKGLTDEKILALATDNDHVIWLGTISGVSKVMKDGEGKLVIEKVYDAGKYTISTAAKAPNGAIWFGTYGNGVIILNGSKTPSLILNSSNSKLPNDNVSDIHFDGNNTVYISTLGGGIIKAQIDHNAVKTSFSVETIFSEEQGLGSNYVYASLCDDYGNLFFATDGGGLQMFKNNKYVNLTQNFKLNSSTVFSLCKDNQGHVWATSNADGVLCYDGKDLKTITMREGLRDEQPQQIIARDNTVFAINSKGIDKINCDNGTVSYYDLSDGDFEPNLNAIAFFQNKIYSGTNNGLLTFRTSYEAFDSIKPKVLIKSFFLNYKPFPLDSIFEFKHYQNSIGLSFDGIWLKNPNKLFFRYKLHGLEEGWQYSEEGKTITYNNLSPGNYTFIVQVQNDEEVWSDPTGHAFIILTPIWKRWWFWLSIMVVGGLSIYFFITYRLKALQKENLLLERRVKERTRQIEQQSQIIERKNVELEQLSLVASKTDNVVLILDQDGKLEYVNESFEKLNGIALNDLKNGNNNTIYELSSHPNIRQIVNDAVKQKKSVNYESLNKKSNNGQEIWQSSTLTPIFDEAGKLKKIIIIDTDVSLRKKQEQIIVQKNKDITDSIAYARKIQHAILPAESLIKSHIPNLFVVYMTKDIVSGDFYWFTHLDNCSIIAAVDCTGHGVPGAFMSLIGYNQLNRIVNEEKITDPKDILFALNKGVLGVLHKNDTESKDGMDMAICKINHKTNELEYAGAMRPLWIVKDSGNEGKILEEVKADKIPIGTKQADRSDEIVYTTHTFKLTENETYYIFTDGYADQFGGEKDKKYSTGRFKELLISVSEMDVLQQEERIKQDHLQWKGNYEQVDDILVIGFKYSKDKKKKV